jgi:hypothetical protein
MNISSQLTPTPTQPISPLANPASPTPKTQVFQPQAAMNKAAAGLPSSTDSGINDVNQLSKPNVGVDSQTVAQQDAGQTLPNGQTAKAGGADNSVKQLSTTAQFAQWQQANPGKGYSDFQAATGTATVPKVAAPAIPAVPAPSAANPTKNTDNVATTLLGINAKAQAADDQADALNASSVHSEQDNRDALTSAADTRLAQEQANEDSLQAIISQTLQARNDAITQSSETSRKDAETAYQASLDALDKQREATQKAYEDTITEQNLNNLHATLSKESEIAAMGGFGSLNSFKEDQETILTGERMINNLVFNHETADLKITQDITDLTKNYRDDMNQIETNKQEAISKNYDEFLKYVQNINDDREKSVDERYNAIKDAQDTYTKNVASINNDSFKTKLDISKTAQDQAVALQAGRVDVDTSHLLGYAADIKGNAILDEAGKRIDVNKDVTKDTQYVPPTMDAFGNVTREGGFYDYTTKVFTPISQMISGTGGASASGGDTPAVRNNNPGNLRGPDGNFRRFKSMQEGFQAQMDDLKAKQTGNNSHGLGADSTLMEMISVYAPKSDGNDPVSYAADVAKTLGITPDTKIGQIDTRQLALAMSKHEDANAYAILTGSAPQPASGSTDYSGMTNKELQGQADSLGYKTPTQFQNFKSLVAAGKPIPDLTKVITDPVQKLAAIDKIKSSFENTTKEPQKVIQAGIDLKTAYDDYVKKIADGDNPTSAARDFAQQWKNILAQGSTIRTTAFDVSTEGQSLMDRADQMIQSALKGAGGLSEDDINSIYASAKGLISNASDKLYSDMQLAVTQANGFGIDQDLVLSGQQSQFMDSYKGKMKVAAPTATAASYKGGVIDVAPPKTDADIKAILTANGKPTTQAMIDLVRSQLSGS